MIDELWFKRALRCQVEGGVDCKFCPYNKDNDKCDIRLLLTHALKYIEYVEKLCNELQNFITAEYGR